MKAAVYSLPCRDVLVAIGDGGAMLAQAVTDTAARLDAPADVVILAVPAGSGAEVAERLVGAGRRIERPGPARYISERGAEFDDLGDIVGLPPERDR